MKQKVHNLNGLRHPMVHTGAEAHETFRSSTRQPRLTSTSFISLFIMSTSDLFITEIDATRRNFRNEYQDTDLLLNVRKEHNKVKEVVESFKNKVDKLIDKQRQDYIQAYETHVQDVQKELLNLREKVYEIANDDTKNERTEKLKDDLRSYKSEAIQLEEGSDELRSTMARLVRELYSAGKDLTILDCCVWTDSSYFLLRESERLAAKKVAIRKETI